MDDQGKSEDLSMEAREMLLKEKELELKEREKKLEELARKGGQETVSNSRGIFSLREQDNSKIFSYDGILGRKGILFFMIIYSLASGIYASILDAYSYSRGVGWFFGLIGLLLVAGCFVFVAVALFACIKRCRDCNISFWWSLLFCFIPITGLYLLFAGTKVDLSKYSKTSDYMQSEEYLESKKSARAVVYAMMFICTLLFIMTIVNG